MPSPSRRGPIVSEHNTTKQNSIGESRFKKASSYIAQYPVPRTVQSALHFTSLADLFTQTPSQLLWEASRHMLQLLCERCSYTYPPLSIARYSFIQLSELEQCRVEKLARGFNTAAHGSNPGSRSRESEALPLSHCALQCRSRFNLGRKRTTEDDKHPGSDHPQCQRRKLALA